MSSCRRWRPRIEEIAALERAERVGIHHLRPHIAVAGGIMIAGEDMANCGGRCRTRFRGHPIFSSPPLNARIATRLGGWVEIRDRSARGDELHRGKALVICVRRKRCRRFPQRSPVWYAARTSVALGVPASAVKLRRQSTKSVNTLVPDSEGRSRWTACVQAVADFVEQRPRSSGESSEGWPSALWRNYRHDTSGATSPSSFCWSRSEVSGAGALRVLAK